MAINKPSSLVVIGGWLGCQPKHLKHYETLYNSLGFDILSIVASPLSVIDSTLCHQSSSQNPIRAPSSYQWPMRTGLNMDSPTARQDTNMQDLAWKVLEDIYNSGADVFIFHCFSNGGCFLWESVCRVLLFKNNEDCNCETTAILEMLYEKCKGVVFDSCPCWFGSEQEPSSKLSQALQHCTLQERQNVFSVYGERIDVVDDNIEKRNIEFFEYLTLLPLDIPQLYLYSKNDELSNHEHIAMMIDMRRSRQKRPVLVQFWDYSIHCNHLRKHGKDYKIAVKAFMKELEVSCEARL